MQKYKEILQNVGLAAICLVIGYGVCILQKGCNPKTVTVTDTQYIKGDVIIQKETDTLELPGKTVFIKIPVATGETNSAAQVQDFKYSESDTTTPFSVTIRKHGMEKGVVANGTAHTIIKHIEKDGKPLFKFFQEFSPVTLDSLFTETTNTVTETITKPASFLWYLVCVLIGALGTAIIL